ncbi:MAG: DNA topoisomerase IV subunit B [Azospira oryzae]|uniref:DNA topoisomerase 4 subunit B n=1 Tax=Pelomicrobium methylotrophicum TaxID=2602750 RepID=A0A5C7ER84_9PROT|nr:DNA topoisomerase IV subunit B [Pelomicrobium methylotrophicum]PZP55206.1 MAG: DNA topoisomerase IV subunit B [Azospira oryzae]PZP77780.1 MAG: DNA topoisomerase IV subunit B [Azospira oryzae]TXF10332.1 type IIA DNA topoisomerase subunit B [Pelomicrobium methylotrophicum]
MAKDSYSAKDIEILEDLSPILHRPGMYTDPQNPNHALVEVIDNAADEGLAGFAKHVSVILHEDGSATVEDDGRGIPIDIHPKKKVPAVQVIFTTLHSGGKFRKTDKDAAYRIAGGLHGVGVCVSNALSRRLEVEVKRDGGHYRIVFADNGQLREPLKKIGSVGPRDSGTKVRFWPDPKYFDSPKINVQEIAALLRAKAMLLPGVRFTLGIEKKGRIETTEWHFPEGIRGYFAEAIAGLSPVAAPFFGERYVTAQSESDSFAEGEGAMWAIAWTAEGDTVTESYVNMIPTRHGGTHVAGLREGVYNAIKNFIDLHSMGQRGLKIVPEDVWSRASYVLAVKMLDPQFKGQVKNELISREAVKLTAQMVRDPFELWLNQHVEEGKRIAELVIRQAQARSRAAQKVERRKSSGVAVLPGKLTDCASDDPERNELFIVEGDSAGGSAKQARDKEFQAVLPLKGKPKNTWQDNPDTLYSNKEIEAIALAIGVDHHKPGDAVDLSGLRYKRIIILADADVDGAHIQVLLLTLFFRHFPKLIERGHVYVAQPPLYRIDVPAQGKGRPARKLYALDDAELESLLEKLTDEGVRPGSWTVSRFKGLGEMNPEQLWETTLNPDTRRVLPVTVADGELHESLSIFNMMMARENAAQRREWMETYGNLVEADIT